MSRVPEFFPPIFTRPLSARTLAALERAMTTSGEKNGLVSWAPLTPAAASTSLAGSLLLGKAKSKSLRASWSIAQEPEVSVFTV
ncbi:hypothetical protein ACGFYU_22590 [Streptomyces sp. NPDC048337]|uniref:hypothetical protein n=1 Tax=Streptomyces sp. NPDC048337 TaxID=3365535 RepID=UPI003717E5C8